MKYFVDTSTDKMSVWRYTYGVIPGVVESSITNKYLRKMMYENKQDRPYFTKEGIHYMRELMRPYIQIINLISTEEALEDFMRTIPYCRNLQAYHLKNKKEEIFDFILKLILVDNDIDEPGVGCNQNTITPWDIHEYIHEDELLQVFFDPKPIIVNITLNDIISRINLSYDHVLGIMIMYRYLHKDHPLSMYGCHLKHEVCDTNMLALTQLKDLEGWYYITIKADVFDQEIYSFASLNFLEGILCGMQWNNIDPHTAIIRLIQWKTDDEGLYSLDIPY